MVIWMALTNRSMKTPLIRLCLWIRDASMTSHSFRHFCKPSPSWLLLKGRVSSPVSSWLGQPIQELGRFFQRIVVTETSRTLLFQGASYQVCLCSVRIVVYEMVNQYCVWDSDHHVPKGHHPPGCPGPCTELPAHTALTFLLPGPCRIPPACSAPALRLL